MQLHSPLSHRCARAICSDAMRKSKYLHPCILYREVGDITRSSRQEQDPLLSILFPMLQAQPVWMYR